MHPSLVFRLNTIIIKVVFALFVSVSKVYAYEKVCNLKTEEIESEILEVSWGLYIEFLVAGALNKEHEEFVVEYSTRSYCQSDEYMDIFYEAIHKNKEQDQEEVISAFRKDGYKDKCQSIQIAQKNHSSILFSTDFERKAHLYDYISGSMAISNRLFMRDKRTIIEFITYSQIPPRCYEF